MIRRAIVVDGIVQGVGFRPFVFALATRHQLGGFVKNQSGTVRIEVEGEPAALDRFLSELTAHAPPLAKIDRVEWELIPLRGETRFQIEPSDGASEGPISISPDVATCEECLAELFDPNDRRFGYPFINCTNCGPRLTIIQGAPYDRPRTTMADFAMCAACRTEYDDPANRRFHAQPIACPDCGPQLDLLGSGGERIDVANPLTAFLDALRHGTIGALKGLGGYHLTCDARNANAVAELRRRKHRDEKPFAIMVEHVEAAKHYCEIDDLERALLTSPRRPIVLLRKRDSSGIADGLAPGNSSLGVMLPYTPLHHLLLRAADGMPLVMTSGNRSDEPIAYRDDEAIEKLAGIADLFLIHNRPIHIRCDDSVTRVVADEELPIRRSRGYAPRPVTLPLECPHPILATGGQLKATFALGRGRQAILSHHLGDLDYYEAYRAFVRDVALYEELFGIKPAYLVHDAHPDYATTRYAQERAARGGIELLSVQHHHAHIASCMAEHGLNESVIGVSFDGTGYGPDGAIWGGEFLVGNYREFRRAGRFRYVGLPGGDQAIREPWRLAAAHLSDAGIRHTRLEARILRTNWLTIHQMLERRVQTPQTSSVGRLFDAVASLAGVTDRVSYEGQAAVQLEWLASGEPRDTIYPFALNTEWDENAQSRFVIDTRPLIAAIVDEVERGTSAARIARRFHSTLVEIITQICCRLRDLTGLAAVVLSGGVFLNALLTAEVSSRLSAHEFRVYRHCLVPPNDGGLSLGQLAIAAARLAG